MENIAADQAEGALQVERAVDLTADHRRLEARRVFVERRDHEVRHFFTVVVPGAAVGQLRRDMLAEHRRDMHARGRQRVVHGRGDAELHHRLLRPAVAAGIEEGVLHIVETGGDQNAGGMVRRALLAGQRGEAGQFGQGDIHAEGARAMPDGGDAAVEIGRLRRRIDQGREHQAGIEIADHRAGANGLAGFGDHADRAALLDQHFLDRRVGADLDAEARRRLGHRLGDRAHAPDGMTPYAFLAVDLAEHVMQQHIGRAGRVGAAEIADDAVPAERRLDRIALEGAVEIIAGRHGEQIEQFALQIDAQGPHPVAEAGRLDHFGQGVHPAAAAGDVRRRAQHQLAQNVGDRLRAGVVDIEHLGVLGREFSDFLLGDTAAGAQGPAIGQRDEIGDLALDHLEAVLRQLEIGDHLGIEQRHGIGGHRILEPRMEFLGHRGAADDRAPLQHRDLQSPHGQIGGANQTVMTAAYDHHITHERSPTLVSLI